MQVSAKLDAVFFDCDGVLADTERDGHRIAFNKGFEENNLRDNNGNLMEWGEEQYGKLCEIGGGKERMMGYWEQVCMYCPHCLPHSRTCGLLPGPIIYICTTSSIKVSHLCVCICL